MKVLDLFSGIGGFSLGLERAGMETIAFCEIEPYCQKVLAKHWPNVPIHTDIKELDGEQYQGTVDVICGGFPCQDLSNAGSKTGIQGSRSSLYGEMLRIISGSECQYAVFENVTALISGDGGRWFARFLYDLAEIGFDAIWHCVSASAVSAHHHRDRVWIVAYPNETHGKGERLSRRIHKELALFNGRGSCWEASKVLADSSSIRRPGSRESISAINPAQSKNRQTIKLVDGGFRGAWPLEPRVGRVANGVPNGAHRLRGLGNAVVPQIPEIIGRAIMQEAA